MTITDVLYRAFRAAHIAVRPKVSLGSSELTDALGILNTVVDQWTASKRYSWNSAFTAYTLTPNHQPHLIGPGLVSPNFAAPFRPVRIDNAAIILTGNGTPNPAPNPPATPAGAVNTNVDVPLNLRDSDWWANQRVKGIATSVPTDLYYSADWDSGQLWLWPIPNFAYGLRLNAWVSLTPYASLTVPFSAPMGYFNALALTTAEELCGPFGVPMPENLARLAAKARMSIWQNNDKTPRIASADYGTRGTPNMHADFNYYTGGPSNP